jgi:protein-tyrosine phosphatase
LTTAPLRILAVCSHNRTRSVMIEAMLASMLADSGLAAEVRSSGFGPSGLPAIDDAVDAMAQRGLDVSQHRSRATTAALVEPADLILTAERTHVVRIAALAPDAFARTMTLPEFVGRATAGTTATPGIDTTGASRRRIARLTAERTAAGYLGNEIAEIADPTGLPRRDFHRAATEIEGQCRDAARLLARLLGC